MKDNKTDQLHKKVLSLEKEMAKLSQELNAKDRDLEIENALELVRMRAMAMKESNELKEVIQVVYEQFVELGINTEHAGFILNYEENEMMHIWLADENEIASEILIPYFDSPHWNSFVEAKEIGRNFFANNLTFEEKNKFYCDLFKHVPELPEEYLETYLAYPALAISTVLLDNIGLYIENFEGIAYSEEENNLLMRFGKVFQQSYTRFLDLQKAEAQAREAEIELALERVRARSMAMHRSEELVEVATVLHNELRSLNVREFSETSIVVHDEPNQELIVWGAQTGPGSLEKAVFPLLGDQILQELYDTWRNKEDFFTLKVEGAALRKHIDFVFPKATRTTLENEAIKSMPDPTFFHCAFFCMGYLELMADRELSQDSSSLLVRFARVFDQAYIRFLDLQKAEAQAQEAQIEAALERLRGRSMGMHKSEELSEIVALMFEEMEAFGFATSGCELILVDEKNDQLQFWSSSPAQNMILECFHIPRSIHHLFQKQWKAWQDQIPRLTITLEGQEKKEFDQLIFSKTDYKRLPEEVKEFILNSGNVDVFSHVTFKHGLLEVADSSPLSEEMFNILERFARVFEQTYTRFLDLQKAEAQAREAQIEASLERVRSRSLAMRGTEEFLEVAAVVYEELKKLEISSFESCGFNIYDEEKEIQEIYNFHIDLKMLTEFQIPMKGDQILDERYMAWKRKDNIFYQTVGGKALDVHLSYAHQGMELDASSWIEKFGFPDPAHYHFGNFSQGYLHIISSEELTDEHKSILGRFAKVFEQAYTRFLDLQKAEEQAREAKIEAALERIRSRSMAMFDSEELGDVASLLYKELINLGISNFFNCGFIIVKEEEGEQYGWLTQPEGDFEEKMNLPYPGDAILKNRLKAWKAKEPLFFQKVGGKTLSRHLKYVNKFQRSENQVQTISAFLPDPCIFYCGNFNEGYLHIISGEELGEEAEAIIARFTKVFQQTYTRFLDLQKAEAQAREAEIELALERVRAKTMAMQKSEELRELVFEYYKQIHPFGFAKWGFEIKIAKEDKSGFYCWISPPGARVQPEGFNIPTLDHWVLKKYWSAYERQIPILSIVNSGDDKRRLAVLLLERSDMKNLPEDVKTNIMETEYVHFTVAAMRFGLLKAVDMEPVVEKDSSILQRFAKVFEQTYTRFLDLQKAEAQAREAMIEASLEKVRGASMAMHKSEDLIHVANVMNQEFEKLGFTNSLQASFVLIDEEKKVQRLWGAQTDSQLSIYLTLPLFGDDVLQERYDAWKRKEAFLSVALTGEKRKMHLAVGMPLESLSERQKKGREAVPDPFHICCGFMKYGYLTIISSEALANDQQRILARMAKVFEQTYTRYLDLQKAEAQARESQIEVALERVRAASMAMHESKELIKVVRLLDQEVKGLGIQNVDTTQIVTDFDGLEKGSNIWLAREGLDVLDKFHIPNQKQIIDQAFSLRFLKAIENGEPFYTEKYSKAEKNRYLKALFKYSDFNKTPKERQTLLLEAPGLISSVVINKNSAISFYHYGLTEFSEEDNAIFRRCGGVFEQAYTRFLDLQKAESQAREAQVEAALERVRSTSMAMHDSEDLHKVIVSVYNQLVALGLKVHSTQIVESIHDESGLRFWNAANGQVYPKLNFMPYNRNIHLTRFKSAVENRESFYSLILTKRQKDSLFRHYFTDSSQEDVPKSRKDFIFSSPGLALSAVVGKHTALFVLNYERIPYSNDENGIIKRFAQVFEQAYTRFLDLKKAEAQAREAQIEAGLERVRSRSMAMHKSAELHEVVKVLYREFKGLSIWFHAANIVLRLDNSKDLNLWAGAGDLMYPSLIHWPYVNIRMLDDVYKSWGSNKILHTSYNDKEKGRFLDVLFNIIEIPKARQAKIRAKKGMVIMGSFLNMTGLQLIKYANVRFTEEEQNIVLRFSKVFEQTYTRFLDLQKAEAQARESQIEAALERVRSRTMAMRKSEELSEVATALYQQLEAIDLEPLACSFGILDDEQANMYFSIDGKFFKNSLPISHEVNKNVKKVYRAWKKGEELYFHDLSGERLRQHTQSVKKYLESIGIEMPAEAKAEERVRQVDYHAYFSQGVLLFSYDHPVAETDVFVRFAKAFEQSYVRFLDLQKAEAQARESEIQLALERVRSAALAMHLSEELSDTIGVLFEQLRQLGMNPINTYLVLYDLDADQFEFHMTGKGGDRLPIAMRFSFKEMTSFRPAQTAWKSGKPIIETAYLGDKRKEWLELIKPMNQALHKESRLSVKDFPKGIFTCSGRHAHGSLGIMNNQPANDQEKKLLTRFAQEFEIVYNRFLDLQRAESQTREAQIEGALERVRAAAMAMQTTNELANLIITIFKELQKLDMVLTRCLLWIFNPDDNSASVWMTNSEDPDQAASYEIPYHGHPAYKSYLKGWETQQKKWEYNLRGKAKDSWDEILVYDYLKSLSEKVKKAMKDPEHVILSGSFNKYGIIQTASLDILSDENHDILLRFSQVFEQNYTRFLDLQKAEAQARDAQIEAALERVRSKTMAMHNSEDVSLTVVTLFDEVLKLGLDKSIRCGIGILQDKESMETWSVTHAENGEVDLKMGLLDMTIHPLLLEIQKTWENDKKGLTYVLEGEEVIAYYSVLNDAPDYPFFVDLTTLPNNKYHNSFYFNSGVLFAFTDTPISSEAANVLKRFAGVFNQTYTRFLDLQKAEAQARDALIEAALERVRAKTMAMHKSEELREVVAVLYKQVGDLGISDWGCNIQVFNQEDSTIEIWLSEDENKVFDRSFFFRGENHVRIKEQWEAWRNKTDRFSISLKGRSKTSYDNYVLQHTDFQYFPEEMKDGIRSIKEIHFNFALMKYGYLVGINLSSSFSDSDYQVLSRFAKVFEQSYTRFLDLEKAEAQAREAQIEAAVERVRAEAMAMHSTTDFEKVSKQLLQQVKKLDLEGFTGAQIMLMEETGMMTTWDFSSPGNIGDPKSQFIRYDSQKYEIMGIEILNKWKEGESYFVMDYDVKKLTAAVKEWEDIDISIAKKLEQAITEGYLTHQWDACGRLSNGLLAFDMVKPPNDDVRNITMKMTHAFEQAYVRFLDLKNAEAQARESQIEAALERVRSKAISMRSSEDIGEATTILFREIEKLEIETMRCGILIIHDNKVMDVWTTSSNKDDKIVLVSGQINMRIHPLLEGVYDGWKKKLNKTQYELTGKDGIKYYTAIAGELNYKLPSSHAVKEKHYNTCFMFNEGALFTFTKTEISPSAVQIFKRFTKVFGLTYQRYRELIESEKREKEANKQSSLDRVRGEIASMRSKDDLNRITPIIWQELINLGVPFFRCGVFIMNAENENIQVYLSDPNGKSLGLMNLDFTTSDLTKKSSNAWRKKEVFRSHWNKEEFMNWTKSLIDLGKIETEKGYQGGEEAPESLDLHFVPFNQGMLYVGNLEPLTEDQIELVRNLSESFSIAYSRYEDFSKLEKAKENVEEALTDLKATQAQLIQSEKMASLGELTAGIAHEIQNPLNFVNNFSEVSSELMEEMNEEIERGDLEEAKVIARDIKQNLEKINHHGKRADAIVKGMLQHSRTSAAEKEPTDINKLADEYLRLAFHGLRAKDKSFNATLETDFDENIGLVNVIPQDIGRVILNLITNAFYAVNEKQKTTELKDYNPTVSVATLTQKENTKIIVRDNGNGIPEKVLDKIFQPFFTTKPTGEGTGLGLSMSYDIVKKGHRGDLKVETQIGEGTTFIMELPITT